jgi:hypothetical protein
MGRLSQKKVIAGLSILPHLGHLGNSPALTRAAASSKGMRIPAQRMQ